MKSTNQRGLWTASFGEIGATLKSLQDHGVRLEHLTRFRAEPEFAKRVAEFILYGRAGGPVHHSYARTMMGKNFFGIEDWVKIYGANFTQEQLCQIDDFPWGGDVLNSTCPLCGKTVKDCHFAFLGVDRLNGKPLTILKFKKLHPDTAEPRFADFMPDPWYFKEKFATETTMSLRWYLLHTNIIPKSEGKDFYGQKKLLPVEYEVPSAITEITKDLLVFKKTGLYANLSKFARCTDLTDGGRIHVGHLGHLRAGELHIGCGWDSQYDYEIGIAASRKLPTKITLSLCEKN